MAKILITRSCAKNNLVAGTILERNIKLAFQMEMSGAGKIVRDSLDDWEKEQLERFYTNYKLELNKIRQEKEDIKIQSILAQNLAENKLKRIRKTQEYKEALEKVRFGVRHSPGNVYAASCSSIDIDAAINHPNTLDGDTVIVPACSETSWTGNVSIPNNKGITLQGAGTVDANGNYSTEGTRINLGWNSLLVFTSPSGNSKVRITGFHFKHSRTGSSSMGAIVMYGTAVGSIGKPGAQDWRVDHNYIHYTEGVSQSDPAVHVAGWTWGLIDHNVFYHQGRAIFHEAANDVWELYLPIVGVGSWDTDLGGPIDWGGPKAVYVENNWAIGHPEAYLDTDQLYDSHWGSRVVFRYNTVTDMYIMTHSGSNNHGRAALQVEAYENDFYTTTYNEMSVVYRTFILQGGTFYVWNNRMHGAPRSNALQVQYPPACYGAGGEPTAYIYPCTYGVNCIDNIGTGPDATASGTSFQPAYAYNNTVDGSPVYFTSGVCNNGEIVIGRDVIHSAKPSYTPYAYPHPLREETPDITPPTLDTASIGPNGTTWTFNFSEPVKFGAGGTGGWSVSMSMQGAILLTYTSGSGSNTLIYTGNKTVQYGETKTSGLNYTQPIGGNGIEDLEGNDLANISGFSVTNNSLNYGSISQSRIKNLIWQPHFRKIHPKF